MTSSIPKDIKLYDKIKKKLFIEYPVNSAYRSGNLVKKYIKAYEEKYKTGEAYYGNKNEEIGLTRWYKEKWVNQRGEIGYKYEGDIYRPSKRITANTPKTHSELTKTQIAKAITDKKNNGRVSKF
jgi:hypothetical protein